MSYELPDLLIADHDDGSVGARGRSWKAQFRRSGWTFVPNYGPTAPRNYPIDIELAHVSVAGQARSIAPRSVRRSTESVWIDHGAVTERLDLSAGGVEQSFVFDRLPEGRGDIVVDLQLATEHAIHAIPGGLRFVVAAGATQCTKAVAIDADGRRQTLAIELDETRARMVIPGGFVEQAALPLVLDPEWSSTVESVTAYPAHVDTATLQGPDMTLVVWQQPYSATDEDCFAVGYSRDLGTRLFGPVTIDFTSLSWFRPQVASNANSRQFLVVGRLTDAQQTYSHIVGHRVSDTGAVSSRINIETADTNKVPDVGGDPFPSTFAYWTVPFVKTDASGRNAVHLRQLDQAGALRGSGSTALSAPQFVGIDPPSISESNATDRWRIAYTITSISGDTTTMCDVSWNGGLIGAPMTLWPLSDRDRAVVSSPATLLDGTRIWYVGYQERTSFGPFSTSTDVEVAVVDDAGNELSQLDLSALMSDPTEEQRGIQLDSDGTRCVVTFLGGQQFLERGYVGTVAYNEVTGQLEANEPPAVAITVFLGSINSTSVAAYRSGGDEFSTRYSIVGRGDNVRILEWGGHASGAAFGTRPTQCGTLPISYSGSPVIGEQVEVTAVTSQLSGMLIGLPGSYSLGFLGCPCTIGVADPVSVPNPLVWSVPNNPAFVGVTLSVQGWALSAANCFSLVDLSDTVDFAIQ